jgi:hypothetical protein
LPRASVFVRVEFHAAGSPVVTNRRGKAAPEQAPARKKVNQKRKRGSFVLTDVDKNGSPSGVADRPRFLGAALDSDRSTRQREQPLGVETLLGIAEALQHHLRAFE